MSRQASGDRSEPRDRIRLAIAAEADERYATPGLVAAGCWLRAERSCDPRAGVWQVSGERVMRSPWCSTGQGRRWHASSERAGRGRWR
jgi:hypothetical protein